MGDRIEIAGDGCGVAAAIVRVVVGGIEWMGRVEEQHFERRKPLNGGALRRETARREQRLIAHGKRSRKLARRDPARVRPEIKPLEAVSLRDRTEAYEVDGSPGENGLLECGIDADSGALRSAAERRECGLEMRRCRLQALEARKDVKIDGCMHHLGVGLALGICLRQSAKDHRDGREC